jgi:hypothetical protein
MTTETATTFDIDHADANPARMQDESLEAEGVEARAARAAQVFAGAMTLATGLAVAGGAALVSADGSSSLLGLAFACLAGCGILQYTARRRFREALIQRGIGEGLPSPRAAEEADADLEKICP